MSIFSYLYDKMLAWSGHRHAPFYLAGVSFAESSFFPIPPDVMLISMGLVKPKAAWQYAFIAMWFSVLGGLLGYALGYFFMDLIKPFLMQSSYASSVTALMQWFEKQGVLVVILAGFTPFPYKLFTLTAGMMHMSLLPFFLGSILGRGLRFFLVSGLLFYLGAKVEQHLRRYIEIIGWVCLSLAVIAYFVISKKFK